MFHFLGIKQKISAVATNSALNELSLQLEWIQYHDFAYANHFF